ncbi:MAG: serine/threonine-protein kinase [Vicinamibacterales bacterium]
MSASWARVRDLFETLVEHSADDARDALERLQEREPEVAAEVRSLLDHHRRAGGFMQTPAAALDADAFDDTPLVVGERIGAYQVEREIGRGGMGRVFLATDTRLHRPVALKLLPLAVAADSGQRERLRREARAAAQLSHPGICIIYALEEIDGHVLIVSEYVEGRSLGAEIGEGLRATAAIVERAAVELSDALASAHARGITHRDLKPDNVMRAVDGRLKILDFGLALMDTGMSAHPAQPRLTMAGAVLGTPAYMAPEQLKGEPADARSDVFALGVVLYELAAGVHPFAAATPLATAAGVIERTPAALTTFRTDLPSRVIGAIERALSKRAADRFATAAEFRDAVVSENGAQGRPAAPQDVAAWWRRHQLVAIALYFLASGVAWQVKEWVPGMASVLFPCVGILAIVGAVFRGHLLFAERMNHQSFARERARAGAVTGVTDVMIAVALIVAGGLVNAGHEVWSLLIMGLGVGVALARVLVERATTLAAFERRGVE